jgi:hypothetical protein
MENMESIFIYAIKDKRLFNMKPKKNAIFEFIFDVSKTRETTHQSVVYIHLECDIVSIDGVKINSKFNEIQLSLKRDFFYLYLECKKNNIVKGDKIRASLNILDNSKSKCNVVLVSK